MHFHRLSPLLIAAIAVLAGPLRAADHHVPSQYATIRDAMIAARSGDRVVLAPGHYREYGIELGSGVTLIGRPAAPASVIIDAQNRGRVLRAESLDEPATVIGLTVKRGHAQGGNPYDGSGGGILVSRSDLRLENVIIRSNRAESSGGGVRVAAGKLTALDCTLTANAATKGGGGIDVCYDAQADFREVELTRNVASWGGGISVRVGSRLFVSQGTLERNQAVGTPALGGAMSCDLGSTVTLKQCLLTDNAAARGGAIEAASGADLSLRFVTLDRNEASAEGAALYLAGASALIDHSIVSFHGQPAFALHDGSVPMITASDIHGNAGGDWVGPLASMAGRDGNFNADPEYCDSDDRYLSVDSPCSPERNALGLVGALGVGCGKIAVTTPVAEPISLQAQPNPFNPVTEVVYSLPADGHARLSVFDVRGRRVSVLVDGPEAAGEHRVRFAAQDPAGRPLASGTYFLVLETGGQRLTSKIMLVR
jgi:hypothetical protein